MAPKTHIERIIHDGIEECEGDHKGVEEKDIVFADALGHPRTMVIIFADTDSTPMAMLSRVGDEMGAGVTESMLK